MATYYYGSLYKKHNNKWNLIYKDIDMNCIKNLMSGWNIEANEVYNVDKSLESLVFETNKFESHVFLGYIEKSKVTNIDCMKYIKQAEIPYLKHGDSIPMLFNEEDMDCLHHIIDNVSKDNFMSNANEWIKLSDEEKKDICDKYFSVYVKVFNYYNGKFYNSNSFDEIIKFTEEKLKDIEDNNRRWKEIATSLDYLKLSEDEKENVWDSFKYEIKDEDNYYNYKLESALMLKHTLNLFSSYDEESIFYIYNDDNYSKQNDFPEWLNSKLGGL